MDLRHLQEALAIQGGTLTIAKNAIPDLDWLLDNCYGGQPIVLSEAAPGDGDGANRTVVRKGKSRFLGPDLPCVATFRVASGIVQATLRYTLPADWKFSDSFLKLPKVTDWRKKVTAPTSVPLDDLKFDKASFVVLNHRQPDADSGVQLQSGINFLGELQLPGPDRSTGVAGAIKNAFVHGGNRLTLAGTVRIPQNTAAPPLEEFEQPWAIEGIPPGILLSAQLDRATPLDTRSADALTFGDIRFQIYSPISSEWLAANPTYAPVFAYTGTLRLAKARAERPPTLSITALQELGGDELLLAGRFTDASVGNLAGLVDIGGGTDLGASMGVLQPAVDKLTTLELKSASLAISMKDKGGIDVTNASVMVEIPDLDWKFGDLFKIGRVATLIDVQSPFGDPPADPMSKFRRRNRVDVTMLGQCTIFQKNFDFSATTKPLLTVEARLAEGETIELTNLLQKYPDCVPSLRAKVAIDYLALTAQHSSQPDSTSVAFAGRVVSEPKFEIVPGLALSEVTVYVKKNGDRIDGALGAVLTIAQVDLSLRTEKRGSDWRFTGSLVPGQTIDFRALAQKIDSSVTLPGFGFPSALTIKTAEVSLALPEKALGDFDFKGVAEFDNWQFNLGPASFAVKALGGAIHHAAKASGTSSVTVVGEIEIGGSVKGIASVRLGAAEVDTVVNIALSTLDNKNLTVASVVERVAGQGQFAALVPAGKPNNFQFSEFGASINLTKSVYVVEGKLKDFGWAYLVYHGIAGPPAKSAYLFAAGLGPGFRFAKLLEALKPVDDVVTVKDAMLGVYALDSAGGLAGMHTLAQALVKETKDRWPFPEQAQAEKGLVLSATIEIANIFAKTYAFQGAFWLTKDVMQGELALWTLPAATDADKKISHPFQLPGIEITDLRLQLEKKLTGASTSPTFALLGHTLLGAPPTGTAPDKRAKFAVRLGLAEGKPALMSIALDSDLEVGGLVAQCFTGDGRNWPKNFIELTFKARSRVYYYDATVDRSKSWERAAASGNLPEVTYKPGFNVDAYAELALGGRAIPLHFTFESKFGADKKPVGFTATGALTSPVTLWCIELASGKLDKPETAYIDSPTLSIDATDPKRWKFALAVGVNFYDGAIGAAEVIVSRINSGIDAGATQLEATVSAPKRVPVLGELALRLTYTRKPDGSHTLRVRGWPDFKILEQVFDVAGKVKELADKAQGAGCGDLVRYIARQTLFTTYGVSPSIDASAGEPQVSVTLTCSMHLRNAEGPVVLNWNPVTITFALPKDTKLDGLAKAIGDAIGKASLEVVRALLQQPDKVALFLAITFAEEGAAYAADLLCRQFKVPGGSAPLIAPAVPTLTTFAWGEILGVGGVLALGAGGLALLIRLGEKVKEELKDNPGRDIPPATDPDKLDTPQITRFAFSGTAFTADRSGVAFAADYEFKLTGPAPFQERTQQVKATTITIDDPTFAGPGASLAAGRYDICVRALRGAHQSAWSATTPLTLEKLVAPAVRLAVVTSGNIDHLEATWTALAGGSRTYDLEILLDGNSLAAKKPGPTNAAPQRWALAELAHGTYTVRLAVRGAAPKYIASGWSAASNPVIKLAAPAAKTLAFSDTGGNDRVRLTWRWTGDATAIAFDARLVSDEGPASAAALNPSATGVEFDSASLAVATYRAETRARPNPASASTTAASDWSSPTAFAIAKLPPPKIVSVTPGMQAAPSIVISIESLVAGADIHYARLLHGADRSSQVEFQADRRATIPLPAGYHGAAQVEARAAKRDGTAIASEWHKYDVVRLAPPTGAACSYDRGTEKVTVRFSPATQDATITASLSHEIQFFAGADWQPVGKSRIIPQAAEESFTVESLPAGPIRTRVRTVATSDPKLVHSPWCDAEPALSKLGNAAVTDVSFDPAAECVRVKLVDAGAGILYDAKFDNAGTARGSAAKSEIECPNPFAPGIVGSCGVLARLTSTDAAVIDGNWQPADPALKLTKFPQPTGLSLAWDDTLGKLAVRFTPAAGTQRHEVQLLANDAWRGKVLPTEPNATEIQIVLGDDVPAGSLAVQVRAIGLPPRTIPGDWLKASGGVTMPAEVVVKLAYRDEKIAATWNDIAVHAPSYDVKLFKEGLAVDSATSVTPSHHEFDLKEETPGAYTVRVKPNGSSTYVGGRWSKDSNAIKRMDPPPQDAYSLGLDGDAIRVTQWIWTPAGTGYSIQLRNKGGPVSPIATGVIPGASEPLTVPRLAPGEYWLWGRTNAPDDQSIPSGWVALERYPIFKLAEPVIASLAHSTDAGMARIIVTLQDTVAGAAAYEFQFVNPADGAPLPPVSRGGALSKVIEFSAQDIPPGAYKLRAKAIPSAFIDGKVAYGFASEWHVSTMTVAVSPAVAPRTGDSLSLDPATGDSAEIPLNAPITLAAFTVEAWVKTAHGTTVYNCDGAFMLAVVNGAIAFHVTAAPSFGAKARAQAVDGKWHHIAAVGQGETVQIYLDGDPVRTAAAGKFRGPLTCRERITVGSLQPDNQSNRYAGMLAELRIWNTARGPQDIQQSMRRTLDPQQQPNLILYYNFPPDGSARELTGRGAPLILHGAARIVLSDVPVTAPPK